MELLHGEAPTVVDPRQMAGEVAVDQVTVLHFTQFCFKRKSQTKKYVKICKFKQVLIVWFLCE